MESINEDLNNTQNEESVLAPEPMEQEVDKTQDSQVSTDYALAWSEEQGNYSEGIAKKTLSFIKNQGLVVNTVLDICCGSGNFLYVMQQHGKKCAGTEFLDSYYEYSKKTYPDMEFFKTEGITDIDSLPTYDLISCNHDVINYLPTIVDWSLLFKKVYSHLNNGGMFVFDYYTKRKLKNWNEIIYNESDKLDYVKNIHSDENSTTITNIYYVNINPKEHPESAVDREYSLNDYDRRFKRTENSTVEYFFDNSAIVDAIKHAGYRYLILTDANFAPVANITDMNRVHVIAIKREN